MQNKSYKYSYDDAGNILTKKEYDYTTGTLGTATDTITYEYSDSDWGDLLVNYDGQEITYDEIGNMLTFGDKIFTWQGRSLKKITEGDNTSSYLYNSDGIRTKKTVNGTETEYFLNGNQIIAQKTGDDVIWFIYDSEGNRVGLNRNGLAYYYLYNLQGDVVGIVRASTGKVVATYEYDAWGNCTVSNADGFTVGNANPFRYRGYYWDEESGLYYLNSRYYDPEIGRFISADCMIGVCSDITSYNMYAYCGNNPINGSDSTGMWFGLDDLIAGAIGAAVGVASQFASDVLSSIGGGSLQLSSWQTYVGAAVGGAIGGVASLYVTPVVGAAIGAGTATLIGQTLENHTNGTKRSGKEIAVNTVTDAMIEATIVRYLPVEVPGITTGRNSMSAVYSSGLTKLRNKTASKMSMKVMGKGFVSEFCGSMASVDINVLGNYMSGVGQDLKNGIPQIPIFWCRP